MDPLRPEQRTDRTGRTQTRWVRDGATAQRGRSLPPVKPVAPAIPRELLDVVSSVHIEQLGRCRPDLLERLAARLRDADTTDRQALSLHISAALTTSSNSDIHHLALFGDAMAPEVQSYPGTLWAAIAGITSGEGSYARFSGIEDLSILPPGQIQQVRALVYAASALEERHTVYSSGSDSGDYSDYDTDEDGWWEEVDGDGWEPARTVIHDSGLVRLLLDHPGQAERIVQIANAEDAAPDIIRRRIEHPQQALSEGVL